MKILVVDDNENYRKTAQEALGSENELKFSSNYKEAIEKISGNSFDLVMIDGFYTTGKIDEAKKSEIKELLLGLSERAVQYYFKNRMDKHEMILEGRKLSEIAKVFTETSELPLSVFLAGELKSAGVPAMITTTGGHGEKEAIIRMYSEENGYTFFCEEETYCGDKMWPKYDAGYWKRAMFFWKIRNIVSNDNFENFMSLLQDHEEIDRRVTFEEKEGIKSYLLEYVIAAFETVEKAKEYSKEDKRKNPDKYIPVGER